MYSKQPQQQRSMSLTFASNLLVKVLPSYSKEAMVGDLREEFWQRKQQGTVQANCWLWLQLVRAVFHGLTTALKGQAAMKYLAMAGCLTVVPTLIAMVAWLSNMDNTSDEVWQQLLGANMHNIVTYGHFWQQVPEALGAIDGIQLFIHHWSVAWTLISFGAISAISYLKRCNAHQVMLMGLVAMLLPYALGWMYINTMMLPPNKLGPIIAFMLFNILYMLVPLTVLVNKVAKREELVMEMD